MVEHCGIEDSSVVEHCEIEEYLSGGALWDRG